MIDEEYGNKLEQLAKVVTEMRKAQRAYFAARKAGTKGERELIDSKKLEAAVDLRLGELGFR